MNFFSVSAGEREGEFQNAKDFDEVQRISEKHESDVTKRFRMPGRLVMKWSKAETHVNEKCIRSVPSTFYFLVPYITVDKNALDDFGNRLKDWLPKIQLQIWDCTYGQEAIEMVETSNPVSIQIKTGATCAETAEPVNIPHTFAESTGLGCSNDAAQGMKFRCFYMGSLDGLNLVYVASECANEVFRQEIISHALNLEAKGIHMTWSDYDPEEGEVDCKLLCSDCKELYRKDCNALLERSKKWLDCDFALECVHGIRASIEKTCKDVSGSHESDQRSIKKAAYSGLFIERYDPYRRRIKIYGSVVETENFAILQLMLPVPDQEILRSFTEKIRERPEKMILQLSDGKHIDPDIDIEASREGKTFGELKNQEWKYGAPLKGKTRENAALIKLSSSKMVDLITLAMHCYKEAVQESAGSKEEGGRLNERSIKYLKGLVASACDRVQIATKTQINYAAALGIHITKRWAYSNYSETSLVFYVSTANEYDLMLISKLKEKIKPWPVKLNSKVTWHKTMQEITLSSEEALDLITLTIECSKDVARESLYTKIDRLREHYPALHLYLTVREINLRQVKECLVCMSNRDTTGGKVASHSRMGQGKIKAGLRRTVDAGLRDTVDAGLLKVKAALRSVGETGLQAEWRKFEAEWPKIKADLQRTVKTARLPFSVLLHQPDCEILNTFDVEAVS